METLHLSEMNSERLVLNGKKVRLGTRFIVEI